MKRLVKFVSFENHFNWLLIFPFERFLFHFPRSIIRMCSAKLSLSVTVLRVQINHHRAAAAALQSLFQRKMPTRVMNKGGVEAGGCLDGMACADETYRGDQRFLMGKRVVFKDVENKEEKGLVKNSSNQNISCSDESSSIGKNSDLSENSMEKSGDGEEVQSSYKGALDAMEALEEVLPIRRGISRFYNGKSKSFASLAEASSSPSIKDLVKPDNPYTRRRRNLLACSLTWDKNRSSSLRSNGGGISKRVTSSTRTTLALAVAMSNSDSNKEAGECNSAGSLLLSSPGKDFSPWRSFSLADLQQCVSVATTCTNSNQLVTKP
ncbi:hypothetical protein Pfo_010847 [Paulownia fortunei]|nr:hypothetical protein Pfo_010847 [Paulownia fortunei]